MASYLDTSFLFKFYVQEEHSDEVITLSKARPVLWVSPLIEVEMACALHRLQPKSDARRILAEFHHDLNSSVFLRLPLHQDIYKRAEGLADRYSAQLKLRSLDSIHLATAMHYNADELATYDTRLAQAAKLSGLNVIPTRA